MPPLALTTTDVVPLKHGILPPMAEAVNAVGWVIVTDDDAWHPSASTTTTLYVPAGKELKVEADW